MIHRTAVSSRFLLRGSAALLLAGAVTTCTDNTGPAPGRADLSRTALTTPNPPQIFMGAGDIRPVHQQQRREHGQTDRCGPDRGGVHRGDNAYPNGTADEFTNCYEPTWGRTRRTHPVAGDHDYATPDAQDYFAYFGSSAGTAGQGYYSFDLGQWHIIALNSNIPRSASSPQMQWLRADLAAHPNLCTLATGTTPSTPR